MIYSRQKVSVKALKLLLPFVLCGITNSPASAQSCVVFDQYVSTPSAAYSCSFGLVSFNYNGWDFTLLTGDTINVIGTPTGTVPLLRGTLNCADSTFTVSVVLSGGCTESYSLQGRFTSDTSWSGTFRAIYAGGCMDCTSQMFSISGTTNHPSAVPFSPLPIEARLEQNFPNPFNPTTTVRFSVLRSAFVTLRIFNQLGQEIATLVSESLPAGTHQAEWNAEGRPSGVYLYRLQAGAFNQTRKLILVK